MLFDFKSVKTLLNFVRITPSKSEWVADKVILKTNSLTGVELYFATPVDWKEKYRDKTEILNTHAKLWETTGGRNWWETTKTSAIKATLISLIDSKHTLPEIEVVVDTRVFQALLSEKGLKTVELFVDTDHHRWGFKTPTGIQICDGEFQDVSTLEEGVRVQYKPFPVKIDGNFWYFKNWELYDIIEACPQAEDVIKEEDTRGALMGIYFTQNNDKWVAQSTDGRTLTEWYVKTPQNENTSSVLLRGDTLTLFKNFEGVKFNTGKAEVVSKDKYDQVVRKETNVVKVTLADVGLIIDLVIRSMGDAFPDFNRVIPTGTPYNITFDSYNVEAICDLYYDSFAGTGYKNMKAGRVDNLQIYFKEVNNYLEVEIRQGGLKHGDVPVKVRKVELSVDDLPKDLYIHFNAKFLVNLLYAIGHEDGNGYLDVNFGYEKEFSPVALSSELGTAVVMPLKSVTD